MIKYISDNTADLNELNTARKNLSKLSMLIFMVGNKDYKFTIDKLLAVLQESLDTDSKYLIARNINLIYSEIQRKLNGC